jgi:hypothetical protein
MINFKLAPPDVGWEKVHIDINGDQFDFDISYIGDTFYQLISCTAALMGTPPFENYSSSIERAEVAVDGKTSDIAKQANVCWDQETSGNVKWTLTKPDTLDEDFSLHIELALLNTDEKHAYDVDFREFCYALAKCFTEVLKSSGICGYCDGIQLGNALMLDFQEFIYIKAFALGKLDDFKTTYSKDEQGERRPQTNLQKEIELIMQDM